MLAAQAHSGIAAVDGRIATDSSGRHREASGGVGLLNALVIETEGASGRPMGAGIDHVSRWAGSCANCDGQ